MTRALLAAILALTLTACVAPPPDPARDHTLMYWPALDGAPVTAERGPF